MEKWVVVTESDGMRWQFDTYEEAKSFLDDVLKYGEKATLNCI